MIWNFILFSLFLAGGVPPVHGQDAQEIIRSIDARQQKIQTLTASFSQKRVTSLAEGPLLSWGIVKFKRPQRIYFLYLRPETMEVALDGKEIVIYSPKRSQAEKYSLSQDNRVSRYLGSVTEIFQKPFSQLSESYALAYRGAEADGRYRFRLRPRGEEVRKFLSRVDLWIDKNSGAILRFEMVEASKDRLSLEFKDLKVNPPLSDEDLIIKIPPSVRALEPSAP